MYYNPYWESNNTPDWAYVYAYGVTDSTGKYTINISLPASAASINVDTGVSYHYFDFCAIYALLSDNTSVNVYEPIFHFAYRLNSLVIVSVNSYFDAEGFVKSDSVYHPTNV